jgi:hypothetical protein
MAVFSATVLMCIGATAVHAAPACTNGDLTIVRTSKLTPSGTLAGLAKAVSDHQNWYRVHGYPDRIVLAPVLVFDKASNDLVASPDQVMTFHLKAQQVPKDKHDAAWDAYVAEYRANSTITSETLVCYPRG